MNENLRRTILGLSKTQRDALYTKIRASSSARSATDGGETALAAWVVPNEQGAIEVAGLRTFLGERLPASMVPETICVLKELPLTVSGKVDHKTLRDVLSTSVMPQDEGMLRTPTETLLGGIWCEVMGLARVGRHDNFFELGGHSLLALRLVAKISKATQQEIPVRFLFINPTIELQAKELANRASLPSPISGPERRPATGALAESLVFARRPRIDSADTEIGTLDAVALSYLSTDMARALGWDSGSMISRWCGSDRAVVDGIIETKWGKIGGITLPYSEATLYDDQAGLLTNIVAALRLASRLGAKAVTMTGLIPSATELGHAVVRSIAASGIRGLPAISTGHATTSAAVALNIGRALKAGGREMGSERVAFVGLGSVGLSVLRLVLKSLPHPREIILCDVYARAERLESVRAELTATSQFGGTIRIATAKGMTPNEVYEASMIVGATNTADIIDIDRLRPGTVIVDDSAPHCFPLVDAVARLKRDADILFTEGGVLSVPEQVREVAFHPAELASAEYLRRYAEYLSHDSRSLTGCVFSGLLTAKLGFPASLGQVGVEESYAHYNVLSELGFSGSRLHCESYLLPDELVEKFRRSFGSS